jgi:L-fuconolactonase
MIRIDAHQHFWRLSERRGAWPPPSLAAIHRDFGPEDLAPLLAAAGVGGTVLVQSLPSLDDTRWLLEIAQATPFVKGVVGWVDFKAATAAQTIAELARHPLLKGLRPMLQDLPEDDWIADPAAIPAAQAMAKHGLVFDALVTPRHLPHLLTFAARHPELAIVIDHGAKPFIAQQEMDPWRADIARLAALPNMHCKISGLVTEAGGHASRAGLQAYVQVLWETFGPRRLVWGSDWPVVSLVCDYASWCAMSTALVDALQTPASAGDRDALFGGNAALLYHLQHHADSSL